MGPNAGMTTSVIYPALAGRTDSTSLNQIERLTIRCDHRRSICTDGPEKNTAGGRLGAGTYAPRRQSLAGLVYDRRCARGGWAEMGGQGDCVGNRGYICAAVFAQPDS